MIYFLTWREKLEKNNSQTPDMSYAFAAIVRLFTDEKGEFYRTESALEFNEEVAFDENDDTPRDLILALIAELDGMKNQICKRMDITEEEFTEFINERTKVAQNSYDSIDKTIDNMFKDDDETDPDL